MPRKSTKPPKVDRAAENFTKGDTALWEHPLFGGLLAPAHGVRRLGNLCPHEGWIVVTADGHLHVHPTRLADPEEWTYALAHALLHLGFGHFTAGKGKRPREWTAACCSVVTSFLG